jgi:hypothetical protein
MMRRGGNRESTSATFTLAGICFAPAVLYEMRAHLRLAEEYARAAREATAAHEHGLAAALFATAIKLSALVDDDWAEVTEVDEPESSRTQKDSGAAEPQRRAG